jgi:hypothetical protein
LAEDVLAQLERDKKLNEFAHELATQALKNITTVDGDKASRLAVSKLEILSDAAKAVKESLEHGHGDPLSVENAVKTSLITNRHGAFIRNGAGEIVLDVRAFDKPATAQTITQPYTRPELSVGNVAGESFEQSTERVKMKYNHSRGKMVAVEPSPKAD